MPWWSESGEQREARRARGITRRHEVPVPVDDALALVKEAATRRAPMMRLLTYTGDSATVSVAGSLGGTLGTGGNIGAAASWTGRLGIGVKVTWAPHGEGTQYTAHAPSVGAMYIMRTEIQSLWRALDDAWFARERGW